jgi:hypothetical protein
MIVRRAAKGASLIITNEISVISDVSFSYPVMGDPFFPPLFFRKPFNRRTAMNIFCQKPSFILVLVATSVIGFANPCWGKDEEPVVMLDKQISQLEGLLEAGKTDDYWAEAARMTRELVAAPPSDAGSKVARRLFKSLLTKGAKLPKTGTDDLFTMQKLASYLLSNTNASAEERRATVPLMCAYLGEIRNETVPNYERKPVTRNVAPPPDVPGPAAAGMDPDAISDPVARAKYKEAIRKNRENILMNTRQTVLRRMNVEMSAPIVDYMIAIFRTPDTPHTLVDECIRNARLTAEETKKVEDAIGTSGTKGG